MKNLNRPNKWRTTTGRVLTTHLQGWQDYFTALPHRYQNHLNQRDLARRYRRIWGNRGYLFIYPN